ncbi:MAG: ribosome maturation factor RimM [Bacteroidota bacterium]
MNSEGEAKRLVRKSVFLNESLLPELDEDSFYDHEIEGFTVIDTARGDIGIAVGVIDHPSNPLLQVEKDGVEVLIPLNLELQKKVNRSEKTLTITTPEGLLEVYLS